MRGAHFESSLLRLGDRLFEFVDDEQARLLGFGHRFAHDRRS